jgi:hypothetical protein
MNAGLEELRERMERATAGLVVPSGLACRAARHRRRRILTRATVAAAVAAAAAVSLSLVSPGSTPARPAAMTARELAYRAAAAAAAQPAVAPGQWVYWQETTETHRTTWPTYQVWTTAGSTKPAYVLAGSIRLRCPNQFQFSPCQVIGHPGLLTFLGGRDMLGQFGGHIPVSYAGLRSLPGNPLALDRYFASLHLGVQQPAANREFRIIEDLLISYVMPPALTAELYRALGDVPGVTVNDHAVDAAGRTGLGLQISVPTTNGPPAYQVDELVINPSTYELMGWQDFLRGQLLWGTAVVKSALVSGPWVVP